MGDQLISVFRFVCRRCGRANEQEQGHPLHLRPQLISASCTHCQAFTWLGGLKGTVVTSRPDAGPLDVRLHSADVIVPNHSSPASSTSPRRR